LPASQSTTARNATEPANVVVMFVVVLAKSKRSNRGIQIITPFFTPDNPTLQTLVETNRDNLCCGA
jgi:hypothetical protein